MEGQEITHNGGQAYLMVVLCQKPLTQKQIDLVEEISKEAKQKKKTCILNCFYFQVARSDSSIKRCSSLSDISNVSTSALDLSYLCLLFMKIPENAFVGRKICQKNKLHEWKFNSRKSTRPHFWHSQVPEEFESHDQLFAPKTWFEE